MRFVAKTKSSKGWRVGTASKKSGGGEAYRFYPAEILTELNGKKRPKELMLLQQKWAHKRIT